MLVDLRQGPRRASTLVDQPPRVAPLDAVADATERQDLDLRAVLLQASADHALAESRPVDFALLASEPSSIGSRGPESG